MYSTISIFKGIAEAETRSSIPLFRECSGRVTKTWRSEKGIFFELADQPERYFILSPIEVSPGEFIGFDLWPEANRVNGALRAFNLVFSKQKGVTNDRAR